MQRALITGITGQDGSYLAEFLLNKGYSVHAITRKSTYESPEMLWRVRHLLDSITMHPVAAYDAATIGKLVRDIAPSELYHLAGITAVNNSLASTPHVVHSNIDITLSFLTALNDHAPNCRLFFASTSEVFGKAKTSPQNEETPFHPRSAYGISKVACSHLVDFYRTSSGMFACNGILYNHESPRRGARFVTKKIVRTAVQIKKGLANELRLGNLDARRDWGYAGDYVEAMWLMLQQQTPKDYIVATGATHTVREFVKGTFAALDLDWEKYVVVDPEFCRPPEKVTLCGDISKATNELDWSPKIHFHDLLQIMVEGELNLAGAS